MLAAAYRLPTLQIEKVKKKGRMIQRKAFGICLYKRDDTEISRFGFIVSTRISKRATERNRIKRILREAIQSMLFDIKSSFDILFLAKKVLVDMSTDDILHEVKNALTEMKILK